jgi:phytoene/squalene synthetase
MRDAEKYEQYATECERIARTMPEEQRKSLLSIAEAWRELARDAERKRRPDEKDKP